MTRKEFEALLLKKGFDETDKCDFCKYIYYANSISIILKFFVWSDDVVFCLIESNDNHFNKKIEISKTSVCYQNITEQTLDEILSQCTKIKTALEMINHIAKGE